MATCIAVAVYAWVAQVQWLLAASFTLGVGELLETTYYLVVLDWGERTRRISM